MKYFLTLAISLVSSQSSLGEEESLCDKYSPNNVYATHVATGKDGAKDVVLINKTTGIVIRKILEGVSNIEISESWSPDSNYIFYHIYYGTKGQADFFFRVNKNEASDLPIKVKNAADAFDNKIIEIVKWENDSKKLNILEIFRDGKSKNYIINHAAMVINQDKKNVELNIHKKEKVSESELDELIKKVKAQE